MVAGYTELWAGAEELTKNDLGLGQATLEVAFEKITEWKMSTVPALNFGSMAARRDWRKVWALERKLKEESGGEILATDDEFEVVAEALSMAAYEQYRVHPDLNIWVIPGFAQDILGCDPVALQRSLEANYPMVGKDQDIKPNTAQWVNGDNIALHSRGCELKRSKMWAQRGEPREVGYTKYYYTGWQKDIMPATFDVAICPELAPLAEKYDEWVATVGYPSANHYIVTRYEDGAHSIGYHFDKAKSIAPNSLITVVKTGECGRPFQLRHRVKKPEQAPNETDKDYKMRCDKAQAQEKAFFDKVLAPGTAVIMTLEANLLTQHGVPEVPECGPSGSWVARTIFEHVPYMNAKGTKRKKQKDRALVDGEDTESTTKRCLTHAP